MTWRLLMLAVSAAVLVSAAEEAVPISLRGKPQTLTKITGVATGPAVIFLPGDGGWRGVAIEIANTIASWGYDVYGFDTKRYLEMCAQGQPKATSDGLAEDIRELTQQVGRLSNRPVALVGWSEGAGMAVAAASGAQDASAIQGVLTLGLPESAVLGWDWKATVVNFARRAPDQPTFAVTPLLRSVAPKPLWMIHGSKDEYTTAPKARELFLAAAEPKRLCEIAGANHRFDGHRQELYRSIKEGLEWIVSN